MSTLRVNKIVNQFDNAGVQFSDGVTISNGLTGDVTYNSPTGTITAGTLNSSGDVSVSGTLTANSFSGNGDEVGSSRRRACLRQIFSLCI